MTPGIHNVSYLKNYALIIHKCLSVIHIKIPAKHIHVYLSMSHENLWDS